MIGSRMSPEPIKTLPADELADEGRSRRFIR